MMSAQQMNRLADEAAQRAAQRHTRPAAGPFSPQHKIPFLGDYVAKGFRRIDAPNPPRTMGCNDGYLFVDASGFGNEREPALTQAEFKAYCNANPALYFGIVEVGQFQVVIGVYERISS